MVAGALACASGILHISPAASAVERGGATLSLFLFSACAIRPVEATRLMMVQADMSALIWAQAAV